MKISSCSCSCGNVRVRGQLVPQGMYPNIPPTERERLRFCKTLFSIQPQSIEIQNFNKVRGRLLSSSCADMTCTSCGSTFRFFSCRGFSYMGRLQSDNNPPSSRQNNSRSFPPLKSSQRSMRDQTARIQQNGQPFSNSSQIQNLNDNNDSDSNLSAPLPSLLTPLISHYKQKNLPQESQKKAADQLSSQIGFNDPPKTDLFNNIDDLDLDDEIEIDRNLSANRNNEESLFANNDDIDFELMFSNKADPVVGSYKQHMGVPIDGALSNIAYTDFQPKSYFA